MVPGRRQSVTLTFAVSLATAWIVCLHPVRSHERVTTTVTYDREIVRILNRKCVACHSGHNLGVPFTTYEQTRPWARAIEEEVLRRHMPPWRAVPGYGQFVNDLGLTNRERQFIVAWVEGNGPKTKDQQVIVNLSQAEAVQDEQLNLNVERWQLGKPDLLRPLPPASVLAGQGDEVRRVVADLGLTSDRWIRALEFRPGDRRVVRAAFFSLEETGQWLGSWTPWYGITTLPKDVAYPVKAGSRVVAEVHYRRADEPVTDQSSLGVYLAPGPAAHSPADLVIETREHGAANQATSRFSGAVRLSNDVNVISLKPDVRPGVQSVEVSARKPDGTVHVLLLVRGALPAWPTPYILKEPVRLPKDTELRVSYYYNRSAPAPLPEGPSLIASVF